jgi:hypothetical protein
VELIGRRWTGAIIRAMLGGVTRFRDLTQTVPGLSDRMLSERLKDLRPKASSRASPDALAEDVLPRRGPRARIRHEAVGLGPAIGSRPTNRAKARAPLSRLTSCRPITESGRRSRHIGDDDARFRGLPNGARSDEQLARRMAPPVPARADRPWRYRTRTAYRVRRPAACSPHLVFEDGTRGVEDAVDPLLGNWRPILLLPARCDNALSA